MNFPNIRREAAAQISITESPREEWEPFTWVNLLGPAFAKKKKKKKKINRCHNRNWQINFWAFCARH